MSISSLWQLWQWLSWWINNKNRLEISWLLSLAPSTSQSSDKHLCVGSRLSPLLSHPWETKHLWWWTDHKEEEKPLCETLYFSEGFPNVCFWQIQWGKINWQSNLKFLDATQKFKGNLWRVCGALSFAAEVPLNCRKEMFSSLSVCRAVLLGIFSISLINWLFLMALLSVLVLLSVK